MEVELNDESVPVELAFCPSASCIGCCAVAVKLNTLYTLTLLSVVDSHSVVMLISKRKEEQVDMFHVKDNVDTVADTLVMVGGALLVLAQTG